MQQDEIAPGARVFVMRLELGSAVLSDMAKIRRERSKLRKQLGKARLARGEGPSNEMRPFAATMNEYSNLDTWQKTKMREVLDAAVQKALDEQPLAKMPMVNVAKQRAGQKIQRVQWVGGRRRAVVLTRYACQPTDEPSSVDVSGGKFVVDALVRAGVLHDDSVEWCVRYAEWKSIPSSERGMCEIEVYELKESHDHG